MSFDIRSATPILVEALDLHLIGSWMTTLELRDARFMRSLLAASDDCIKVIDLDGQLRFMSEGGQRVMEVSDFNALAGCPWPDFWSGEGHAEAKHAISEARAGRSYRFQAAANTAAGNPKHWDVKVSPILGPDGRPESILSVSRDITELKSAEERQTLLAQELKHRMKNTIAMVQAIAGQTLRGDLSLDDARNALTGRLAILGAAQDLLTQSSWARAQLRVLVGNALAPHGAAGRCDINGADREISSKCALALALALHELTTNAIKYGALSNDNGRVEIAWTFGADFRFVWREIGGPPVSPPSRQGFGSRMIERALAGYFQGTGKIEHLPNGLVFTLVAPLAALDDEA
ncbi:MAG TPA: HWE histidine kinase domain-containing protein [Bosea sp. (in: a-proteobacteria)]|uniref:sensor histidine kinase n=1 Tax=Bosea sp. (in: a-proteobacteria) TaxID=1871050 RepID=UPI002E12CC4F|nr:HWE histidine kinase domain-containing protein [Bosea sp. (in: a-proteobacteria)]